MAAEDKASINGGSEKIVEIRPLKQASSTIEQSEDDSINIQFQASNTEEENVDIDNNAAADNKKTAETNQKKQDWKQWLEHYVLGEAPGLRQWCCHHGLFYVVLSCFFRGIGQVVFMDNPWTGFIMFVCLMYFNYYYALLGLIGGLTNYLTAIVLLGKDYLLLASANYLNNGIFCYNGLLVGLLCGTFVQQLNTSSDDNGGILFLKLVPCCMVFSYVCTSIHVGMTNIYPQFPVFTFPFNFAGFLWLPISLQITWIFSTLQPYLVVDHADPSHPNPVQNVYNTDLSGADYKSLFFYGIFRSPVQIYLCSNEYLGIVFVFAIAICNWRASILCLWGSCVGTLFAALIGIDLERIYFGLHGYNAALTMMGVGCIFAKFNLNNFIMACLHSCICVFIELAMLTVMAPSSMPYLTLPFCLSTMFFSVFAFRKKQEIARKKRKKRQIRKNGLGAKQMSIRGAPQQLDRRDSNWDDLLESDQEEEKNDGDIEKRGAPRNLDGFE